MRSIAIYNLKGGVGKTATAVNLAALAAESGGRTLVWDLDPQAAASWYLRAEPVKGFKAGRLIKGKIPIGQCIQRTAIAHLDVLPADLTLRNLDIILRREAELHPADAGSHAAMVFERWLSALSETYRLIIFDCPASLSDLAATVLQVADLVVIPVIPTHLSFETYGHVQRLMTAKKLKPKKLVPVLTMVDRRKLLHQTFCREASERLGRAPIGLIPYASDIEKMGNLRQPLLQFAPRSAATLAYRMLWKNLAELLRQQ
ncbi:ParA family protein [Allohahella marinimesophila]|uniref:AAA family ATPase n=1 Tax=Allohahella marinimesophila TaxID=1054972 RepID=A0ABP7NJR7_9GAMM